MNTLWVAAVLALPLGMKAPDPADVKPGMLGFGLFLALAVATVLLWLSMRKQLKKVNFVEQPDPQPSLQADPQRDSQPGPQAASQPDPPLDASEQPRA